MSLVTPVLVSLWVRRTALQSLDRRRRIADLAGSGASPHSISSLVTAAP